MSIVGMFMGFSSAKASFGADTGGGLTLLIQLSCCGHFHVGGGDYFDGDLSDRKGLSASLLVLLVLHHQCWFC